MPTSAPLTEALGPGDSCSAARSRSNWLQLVGGLNGQHDRFGMVENSVEVDLDRVGLAEVVSGNLHHLRHSLPREPLYRASLQPATLPGTAQGAHASTRFRFRRLARCGSASDHAVASEVGSRVLLPEIVR